MSDSGVEKPPLSIPELITRLNHIGMGEYEAKLYIALSTLRVATARELHEITRIPRTRVYDTLDSLIMGGYVVLLNEHPARYHVADITATFERIKRRTFTELEELSLGLASLERDQGAQAMRAYELHTGYAITHQIQMILQRVKTELIILCHDPSYLDEYLDTLLIVKKRAALYLITSRDVRADDTRISWYTGKKDLEDSIFRKNIDEVILTIIADRRETLIVHTKKEGGEGVFIPTDPRSDYFARKILRDITPSSG